MAPIHDAARGGDLIQVKRLVEMERDSLHDENEYGGTALMGAANNGHVAVARFLLENSARIDKANIYGWTALYLACTGCAVILEAPLQNRCSRGRAAVVDLLLDKGANPMVRTPEGFTPLMGAAYIGYEKIVQKLLAHGGSVVDAVDDQGRTALAWACQAGRTKAAKLLLENGANPRLANCKGKTPEDIARDFRRYGCIQLFEDLKRQAERTYLLCKARWVCDDVHSVKKAPTAAKTRTRQEAREVQCRSAPGYLRKRLREGSDLPDVRVRMRTTRGVDELNLSGPSTRKRARHLCYSSSPSSHTPFATPTHTRRSSTATVSSTTTTSSLTSSSSSSSASSPSTHTHKAAAPAPKPATTHAHGLLHTNAHAQACADELKAVAEYVVHAMKADVYDELVGLMRRYE